MNKIQSKILAVYNSVQILCDRHAIPFYAIGGTCLGAVRHNGFIPWDDDMDIAVPIEYYDDFFLVCAAELPEGLSIYSPKDHLYSGHLFCKIVNDRTTFIADDIKEYPDSYKGVFVDIMPIAGVPSSKCGKFIYILKLRLLAALNAYRRFDYSNSQCRRKRLFYQFLKPLIMRLPYEYFLDKYFAELRKHPMNCSGFVGYTWSPKRLNRLTFPAESFSDTVDLPFENTTMRCPAGYDVFLKGMFGNYMELPPENERFSGHAGFVDLDTPYTYYQKYYKERGNLPWEKK